MSPDALGSSHDALSAIAVVEPDPIGHRLAYVRALLDDASRSDVAMRVVSTAEAKRSDEWREHLGDLDVALDLPLDETPRGTLAYARLIRRASPCAVLDADAHLPALILARLSGARFGMLVTRPLTPKVDPRWRRRTLGKTTLCLILRMLGVNVRLLVSPFATEHPWEEVSVPARLRLPTVVDPPLIPRSHRTRIEARRALGLDPKGRVWVVAGAINDTKGLPVILQALDRLPPDHHLVVAGTQDAVAAGELAHFGSTLAATERLTIIERMMTDAELADVLRAADGVLVTKTSGLSSGIAIGAIDNGTPVICTSVNPQRGPGFVCFDGSVDDLARTLCEIDPDVVVARAHTSGRDRSMLSLLPFGPPARRSASTPR